MLNVSEKFQSSFELMGYITFSGGIIVRADFVSKLFRAYGLYNTNNESSNSGATIKFQSSFELMGYITAIDSFLSSPSSNVSKLFRAYGLYNNIYSEMDETPVQYGFKALSSLWVI